MLPLLMAGASLGSGILGYLGARNASEQQAQAAAQALAFQKRVYNEQAPYRQAGLGALGILSEMYGLGSGGGGGNITGGVEGGSGMFGRNNQGGGGGGGASPGGVPNWRSFLESPDYRFSFDQGMRGLESSAAARGGLLSGNFLRGATQYGQGMASTQLGNFTNRMMGIAGLGKGSGENLAGQIGHTMMGAGAAGAAGTVGGINAITGSIGSGINNYLLMNRLNNNRTAYEKPDYYPDGYLSGNVSGGVSLG